MVQVILRGLEWRNRSENCSWCVNTDLRAGVVPLDHVSVSFVLRHEGDNPAQWGLRGRGAAHLAVINLLHGSLIGPLQRLITSTNGLLPAAEPQTCRRPASAQPLGVVKEQKQKMGRIYIPPFDECTHSVQERRDQPSARTTDQA